MSEFQKDIKNNKKYDEDGNELDRHGFKIKVYPDGLESVRKSVDNLSLIHISEPTRLLSIGDWVMCV